MIALTFDQRNLSKQLTDLSVLTGISMAAAVTRTARLWCRDCIRATPPTGKGDAFTNKGIQRKLGERKIAADVAGRAFPLLSSLTLMQEDSEFKQSIDALIAKGNYKQATALLRAEGINVDHVIAKPTHSLHQSRRSKKTGRVLKRGQQFLVTNKASLDAYVRQAVKRSGRAKRGWALAASRLKLGKPGWGGHNEPGHFRGITDKQRPGVEFGNGVPFMQRPYYERKIMRRTLSFRERAMRLELERYWRAAGSGSLAKLKARFAKSKDSFEALEL